MMVDAAGESPALSKLLQNTDLFSAGGDDSDSDGDRDSPPSPPSPPPPSATVSGKRKKSAAAAAIGSQPEKKKKTVKLKKSELSLMYSESQRLIRESTVRLPEYQPKTKSLDSFLNKLRSRPGTKNTSLAPHSLPTPPPPPPSSLEEHTPSSLNKENGSPVETERPHLSPSPPPPPPSNHHLLLPDSEDSEIPTDNLHSQTVDEDSERYESQKEADEVDSAEPVDKGGETVYTEGEQADHPTQPKLPLPSHPKQTSLKSLFAKQTRSVPNSSILPSHDPTNPSLPPPLMAGKSSKSRLSLVQPSCLPPAPKLSSIEEFSTTEEEEKKEKEREKCQELTPLEKLQLRLMGQVSSGGVAGRKRGREVGTENSVKTEEEEEGEKCDASQKPLISDDIISKLKDKPGAIREVWRSELRKQMSQRLAEERKEMEEAKRFYNEELPDDQLLAGEEAEAEFTDPDTSDCEFLQNEAEEEEEEKEGESDACSDLDEEEGVEGDRGGDVEEPDQQRTSEHVDREKTKEEEVEEEGYSAGDESECDENEEIQLSNKKSKSFKNKQKLLESEDEEESGERATTRLRSLSEEASMGPLALVDDTVENTHECSLVSPKETLTQPIQLPSVEEEGERGGEEDEGGEGGQTPAVPDSDKDNSLENSLLWGPSLPPAQPWTENTAPSSLTSDSQHPLEETQWTVLHQPTQDDEMTHFLDANGLLDVHKEKRRSLPQSNVSLLVSASGDAGDTSSAGDELLALCSGRFETQSGSQLPGQERQKLAGGRHGISGLLRSTSITSQPTGIDKSTLDSTDMNEVIGLCSGVFPTNTNPAEPFKKFGTKLGSGTDNSSNEEEEEEAELREAEEGAEVMSWAQRQRKLTSMLELAGEDEDIMPRLSRKRKRGILKPKATKGERLAEFVESEAELSGEDIGSDLEEDEEGGGVSEYEDDGHQSDVPLSDSELWHQVNKAHMKETMADDRADLKDLKERFLLEGDLYEDGLALKNGFFRSRKFMGNSEGSLDLFAEERREESGGEEGGGEEENTQMEAMRRKDRLEREEFIKKCREQTKDLLDEDSQSILNIIRDKTTPTSLLSAPSANNSRSELPVTSSGSGVGGTQANTRRGSFLRHKTATLRRLSSQTSAVPSVSSGKSFVFHQKAASESTPPQPPSNHENMPPKKVMSSFKPPMKKAKMTKTQSTPNGSVFNLF